MRAEILRWEYGLCQFVLNDGVVIGEETLILIPGKQFGYQESGIKVK